MFAQAKEAEGDGGGAAATPTAVSGRRGWSYTGIENVLYYTILSKIMKLKYIF